MFARPLAILALALTASASLGTIAAAGGGCAPATVATSGAGIAVAIRDCGFAPTILRVPVGAVVTFTNAEAYLPHVVSGIGWGNLSYNGSNLLPGQSQSQRFEAAGIYPYMCYLHPGMAGAIVVGDATTVGAPATAPLALAGAAPTPAPLSAPTAAPTSRSATPVPELALGIGLAAVAGGTGYALARRR